MTQRCTHACIVCDSLYGPRINYSEYANFSNGSNNTEVLKTPEEILREQVKAIKSFYVIGSLRNENITSFANELQAHGYEAFADWKSPGPDADDYLRDYAKARGLNYRQTLETYAARHIFEFDLFHLKRTDAAVMLMPSGRSCHLEAGFVRGLGKPAFIIFDKEPERIDVMYLFCSGLFFSKQEFFDYLKNIKES